jgi:hypothetical protein
MRPPEREKQSNRGPVCTIVEAQPWATLDGRYGEEGMKGFVPESHASAGISAADDLYARQVRSQPAPRRLNRLASPTGCPNLLNLMFDALERLRG